MNAWRMARNWTYVWRFAVLASVLTFAISVGLQFFNGFTFVSLVGFLVMALMSYRNATYWVAEYNEEVQRVR